MDCGIFLLNMFLTFLWTLFSFIFSEVFLISYAYQVKFLFNVCFSFDYPLNDVPFVFNNLTLVLINSVLLLVPFEDNGAMVLLFVFLYNFKLILFLIIVILVVIL